MTIPTLYTDLYTVFQSQIQDSIFNTSIVRDDLSKQYLINSITKFRRCLQDLNDRDDILETFNIELIEDEKQILGNLMVIEYLSSQIISIELVKQTMTSKDFSMTSQSAHLDKLLLLRDSRKKEISKMIVDYTYNFSDLKKLK